MGDPSRRDQSTARGIAVAAAHPLGAGATRYRVGGSAGVVDTVPFGTYQRSWLPRVGSFNEKLLTNEDYEYNVRIREKGGVVYFDPRIHSIYLARGSLQALARQYFRYGYWKAQMLQLYPRSVKVRQLLPPVFTSSVILLIILSLFWPFARVLLGSEIAIYIGVVLASAILPAWTKKEATLLLSFPLAIGVMHISWGTGFLWNLIRFVVGVGRDR